MITSEKSLKRYCKNFKEIENYEEALQSSEPYDLHHRKEIETLDDGTIVLISKKELKDSNLYYHRQPEEVIFIKHSEHITLHDLANNPMSGKTGDKNHMFGKKHSDEAKAKMSVAHKGKFRGEESPHWKGDLAGDQAKRVRIRKQKRREASST